MYKDIRAWLIAIRNRRRRLLAEQGDADAQFRLGQMYYLGWGVSQDYEEARKWYRKAADQGHAEAQLLLGVMYDNGWGVLNDNVTAHMWFSVASANGSYAGADNRKKIEEKMTPAQMSQPKPLQPEFRRGHCRPSQQNRLVL